MRNWVSGWTSKRGSKLDQFNYITSMITQYSLNPLLIISKKRSTGNDQQTVIPLSR